MIRKSWSTADVSAYLDGALAPEVQAAFETAVSEDTDLQRRVTEMRQVVTLMRSIPLRESPRNYLLTPSMVSERKPQSSRLRIPLAIMRVATSAAAAAFAITSGLAMMRQGAAPGAITRSVDAPAPVRMLEMEASEEAAEVMEAPMAQVAAVEREMEAETADEPPTEKVAAFALEEGEAEDATAPALAASAEPILEAADTENAAPLGMGGGGEPPAPEAEEPAVADGAASEEPESDPGLAEEAVAETSVEAPAPTTMDEPSHDLSDESSGAAPSDFDELGSVDGADDALWTRGVPPRRSVEAWTPIVLGLTTVALAGVTFWMSRRHRG